jgi:hypothetical protein
MKYDSLSALMSPSDVSESLTRLERCRDAPLFITISDWGRSGNRLKRLLNCPGMSKLLECFLLFLATMASSDAEDSRLAKDGGEVRIQTAYAYCTANESLAEVPEEKKSVGHLIFVLVPISYY